MSDSTPQDKSILEVEKLLKSNNFIDQFTGLILQDIPDCKSEWGESCSVGVLSTLVGPKKKTFTKIGPLNLNIWHYYLSPSGTDKTNPLRYFVEPLMEIANDILNDANKGNTEEEDEEKVKTNLMLPHTFSIEALNAIMRKKANRTGMILIDEMSSYFKEIRTKTYMTEAFETYSKLYDCQTIRMAFVKAGPYRPIKEPYVTCLFSSTPEAYRYIPEEYCLQGMGNRVLHIVNKDSKKLLGNESPDDYFTEQPKEELVERLEALSGFANRLIRLRNNEKLEFVSLITEGSLLMENKHKIDRMTNETSDTFLRGYLHRMNEMTLKLTALHTLGRTGIEATNMNLVTPDERDAEWAIAKVWRHFDHFKLFLQEWGRGVGQGVEPTVYSYDKYTEEVRAYLSDFKNGLPLRQFNLRFKWDSRSKEQIIKQLYERGEVAFFGRKSGKRILHLYSLPEYRDSILNTPDTTELIDWDFIKIKFLKSSE